MFTNTKATPKSCSCRMCRRGKRSGGGQFWLRNEQRAHRQTARIMLLDWSEDADTPLLAPRSLRLG